MGTGMKNKFQEGDIVHHTRYDYRGVVFGWDPVCAADETWYQSNQTQPERNQPWYHILVDRATHTTYVAEANLEADPSKKEITHPTLKRYFTSYHRGRYYRESVN